MDLAKIRLRCAQNYLKILSEGNAPISYASGANIKLSANVIAKANNGNCRLWDLDLAFM
jgi:hypothetical protein